MNLSLNLTRFDSYPSSITDGKLIEINVINILPWNSSLPYLEVLNEF